MTDIDEYMQLTLAMADSEFFVLMARNYSDWLKERGRADSTAAFRLFFLGDDQASTEAIEKFLDTVYAGVSEKLSAEKLAKMGGGDD